MITVRMSSSVKSFPEPKSPQTPTAQSEIAGEQQVTPSKQESSRKEKVTCLGCNKTFLLLLSHLERTKSCQSSYDMGVMREEAKSSHREQMAARKRYLYKNDPNESQRKRSASNEYYKKHSSEKKETMAAYNEKHKEGINESMQDKYYECRTWNGFKCSICEKEYLSKRSLDYHEAHSHKNSDPSETCQICDKKFAHLQSLERHMKEVHSGEKHNCAKCPATFTRKGDLENHLYKGWHYINFYCKPCNKTLVFKSLGGLIEHTIVKQSREEVESGMKHIIYKSGIVVTCKSKVESIQMEEGEHIKGMPRKDKVKAEMKRYAKKENVINEGLKIAAKCSDAPKVKLELKYNKHEDVGKGRCRWCYEQKPYPNEYCEYRIRDVAWELQNI